MFKSMQDRRNFLNIFRGLAPPASDSHWIHVNRPAMACRFEVTLPIWDQAGVRAARDALDEVDRLEQQLTVFRESSEVSYINRNAAVGSVTVAPRLFGLLVICQKLCRESEGAFDITSGPRTRCWGLVRSEGC